ncbi:hypothetical protein [Kitasatospora sp. NPDC092286]|uniref:hypothetical protein n=1 Tax=Kitasatospora sp. NPDC092286 TaxID=3364087 RepID=UPI0038280F51
MRRATIALLTAGLIATATACSSSSDKSEGPSTPTATNGATLAKDTAAAAPGTATTTATPAAAAFTAVAKAVPTAKLGKTVTAEDDPNHLLGRPGQYTSKVTFTDSRIKDADVEGQDEGAVVRGGAVEVFAADADAKARAEYIQGIVKSMPAAMEYDYVHGPVLIRVSKILTPAQAKEFQAAIGG